MSGATGPRGGGFRSATGTDPRTGLLALAERVHKARERALPALAIGLVRQIKIELSQPGHGRVYLRGATNVAFNAAGRLVFTKGKRKGQFAPKAGKGRHVASAPGEPPAVDLGNLRGSIAWEWIGKNIRVGTNVIYALWLEFGARLKHGVLLPRPFMRTAVEKFRPFAGTILRFNYTGLVGEHGSTPPPIDEAGD